MISISKCSIEDKELDNQILEIIHSGQFINGNYVKEFSKLWAKECGKEYCVPVASGSSALTISLRALKHFYPNRSKVIVPTFSFAATAFSVIEAGLEIIYCGVDKNLLLDQQQCLDIISKEPNILAIIPVAIYGQELNLQSELLNSEIFILEDACQAHGVENKGNAACYSFYPSKNLGTIGNGGAIVTDSYTFADYCRMYSNYGDKEGQKYSHKFPSTNSRLDEIQACALVYKLKKHSLKTEIKVRNEQAIVYEKLGVQSFLDLGRKHTWHIYPILCNEPDYMVEIFKEFGIQAGRHYPYELPEICIGNTHYVKSNYSYLANNQVSLPLGSHLDNADIYKVCNIINQYFKLNGQMWVRR